MAFNKQTVNDIELAGKTVLVRVDYNVPLNDDGSVRDDYRIKASLPTIQYLLHQNCRIILISHLGRPEGSRNPKFSLRGAAERLGELLDQSIKFADDCVGPHVHSAVNELDPMEIMMLENLRFHAGEETNDATFAKELAGLAEVFIQDGFGVVHRAHASTDAITKLLPSVAGLLLESEANTISEVMTEPKRPLLAIIGGAKVSDKIPLLERFVTMADRLIIGGAMANTFLKQQGFEIGKSTWEEAQELVIQRVYNHIEKRFGKSSKPFLELPESDVAVAKKIDPNERRMEVKTQDVAKDDYILDFGRSSTDNVLQAVREAGTVIWNGPLGMTELPQFVYGSMELMTALKEAEATTIIGGGDTAGFVVSADLDGGKDFDLVSTGGGAVLGLMAGQKLPGIEALLDK